MGVLSDTFYYKWLKRPITLYKTVDQGKGATVILLHGIGRSGGVWKHVIDGLSKYTFRVLAYDLLGFGESPKPSWLNYNIDDHAKAVINSLVKLKSDEPFIVVGHSMGCLIAVRVARLRPDLVRHLVLYEMPLYDGLPQRRIYRLRLGIYAKFYEWIINYQPSFNESNAKRAEKLAKKISGFEVDEKTWTPFIKSLKNSIMTQTASEDVKFLKVPMDVIYGTFDMLVIRGEAKQMFGNASELINTFNVKATHTISAAASKLIVKRIVAANASLAV